MQKLITVRVDTRQLNQNPGEPFSMNEVDSVNELLEQGWEIEDWDILKEGQGDDVILFLVILNDQAMLDREDEYKDEFDFDEENDIDESGIGEDEEGKRG